MATSTPRAARAARPSPSAGADLALAFLTNERINQLLLDQLDPALWNRFPPSSPRRSIATTFAHIHNVRRMLVASCVPRGTAPPRLDRARITPDDARRALTASAAAMANLLQAAAAGDPSIRNVRPDPAGFLCSAVVHEAHHRGQICHWARELGAPISHNRQLQLWDWIGRSKEAAGAPPVRR